MVRIPLAKKMKVLSTLFSILFFPLFFSASSLLAQGTIDGKVTDEANGEELIGATISLENSSAGAVTDVDGKFRIDNVAEGNYSIKVSYIGYDSKQLTGVAVKNKQTLS